MSESPGWDPVPWMIGGGAQHSTNIARGIAHAAFDGREGIVRPQDLEVRAQPAPDSTVRVYPGTCSIKNRATGIVDEVYAARHPSLETVGIAATDSSGSRSDLIIARIEDPTLDGEPWVAPDDPKVGPYVFTRVIPNVPSTTRSVADLGLGFSAIALARVDMPASTSAVQQSYLTDLRKLARRNSQRELAVISTDGTGTLNGDGNYRVFAEAEAYVDVPEWATHVKGIGQIAGVSYGSPGGDGTNGLGALRFFFGPSNGGFNSEGTSWNFSNGGGLDRFTMYAGADGDRIPAALRGTSMRVQLQARYATGNEQPRYDRFCTASIDLEFYNKAEANL